MMRVAVFVLTAVMCAGWKVEDENGLDTLLLALSTVRPQHRTMSKAPHVLPVMPRTVKMNDEASLGDDAGESDAGASADISVASEKIAISDLSVGAKVEGTIVNVAEFGAFIDIGAAKDGLLHVREVDEYVDDARNRFKKGDKVSANIKSVNEEKQQFALTQRGDTSKQRARPQVDLSEYENADEKASIPGVVVRIADFGAFVRLKDGVDGMLHISQLSDDRVENVADVVKVGDKVDVRVIDFEQTKKGPRISLSMRTWGDRPKSAPRKRQQGDLSEFANAAKSTFITGTVNRVTDFGAFVQLKEGVDGLLHISQMSEDRVESPSDVVNVGDVVNVRVVDFDAKGPRISLSMLPSLEDTSTLTGDDAIIIDTGSDDDDVLGPFEVALERMKEVGEKKLKKEKYRYTL